MSVNIAKEVPALGRLTVKDLRARHIEVFGEATRSGNKDWLRKGIDADRLGLLLVDDRTCLRPCGPLGGSARHIIG